MAIDVLNEECLTLAQASRVLPRVRGSKRPHPMTVYRWAVRGLKTKSGDRVMLETAWVGGTRVTSVEALERFFTKMHEENDVPLPPDEERRRRRLSAGAARAIELLKQQGMVS